MAGLVEGYTPYAVHIAKWGMDVTIVRTEGGQFYFAVSHVCARLGVSLSSQLEWLHADEKCGPALEDFNVPTAGGTQRLTCLRKLECAYWIIHISPRRARADVRGRLEELQADLMATCDRLVWGDLSELAGTARTAVGRPLRIEASFGCLRCGAPHKASVGPDGFTFQLDE